MRRIVLTFFIVALLTQTAKAVDVAATQAEMIGSEALEENLPDYAENIMEEYSPTEQADFTQAVGKIFSDAISKSGRAVKNASATMLRIVAIVILCQMVRTMENDAGHLAVSVVGALSITACCITDMQTMIGLGRSTMDELTAFSGLLLPVMATAAAASGMAASASAMYAIAMVFTNILVRLCRYLIVPCVYAELAMAMVDGALEETRMNKLREVLDWAVNLGLKVVMYGFTGFLAVTGILSGSTDAAALKAAKFAFSSMIPVVGGIVSNAAETVLASAGLLKNAAGTFGMLAILAIFIVPFLRMGIFYLGFKFTSALCGILGSKQGGLLDAISRAMGSLLAMTGSCAIMCLLSCCCFLRVVRP